MEAIESSSAFDHPPRRDGPSEGDRSPTTASGRSPRGDAGDGLPGVKGIGEKTATQLIQEYGDLAGVRAAADPASRLTPARRRNLLESAPYLDVAPTVVRVATDVPLPAFDPALPREARDPMALESLADRWGLGTSLTRVLEVLATR